MNSSTIDFQAFRLASQKSEEKRLGLLLGLFGTIFGVIYIRHWVGGIIIRGRELLWTSVILFVIVFAFSGALEMVKRANRAERLISSWIWGFGLCVEALIPTLSLLGLVLVSPISPLRVLGAPALLLYGIFAVATVLRLSPRMSLLFGGLSAAGYSVVLICAVHRVGSVEWSQIPFLATYPVYLLLTGVMAAFVSGELRRHTIAALEAADLRRRSELLKSELKIAREIQQSLFPRETLKIPGFEVIGWCKPATETGGDYYDWCKLPSAEGFVMLGDATGHGLGPALLIASCRAYVRADLPQNRDLAGFLNRLNERLSQDTDGSRYVTFVGAILDEQTGQVKLVSAGHCPALVIWASNGQVEQVGAQGIPLGMMPGRSYPEGQSIPLGAGDRIVVYTDGITEAKRLDGTLFGIERLIQSAVRHSNLSGQAFIDALYRDVTVFLGSAMLNDDLTLLSIRRS